MTSKRLSKNFTLEELTATSAGLSNKPNAVQELALLNLVENILQPIRDHFRAPLLVNSGFRSEEVNLAIKGHPNSQHKSGEAADIEFTLASNISNRDLFHWIIENLNFDQVILEGHDPEIPSSGWVHVSFKDYDRNRREALQALFDKHGNVKYFPMLNIPNEVEPSIFDEDDESPLDQISGCETVTLDDND